MAAQGGGFSIANMFSNTGIPNNAAVANDNARLQNQPGQQGTGEIDPATGQPRPKNVPGTGMPNDMNNPGADPAGVTGKNMPGTKANPNDPGSPLDAFSDIFKMDDASNTQIDPLTQKLLELDPKKFSETVSKMDFTRNINPELVQKALQGDVQAFNSVLNTSFQGAFAASTQMMVGIMEQAFSKNNGRFNSTLDSKFRSFQINSTNPTNKVLNHPAAKPVLAALRQQIAQSSMGKNLSAQEITQKAEEYFLAMGDALGSLKEGDKNKPGTRDDGTKEIDWGGFLEGQLQQ